MATMRKRTVKRPVAKKRSAKTGSKAAKKTVGKTSARKASPGRKAPTAKKSSATKKSAATKKASSRSAAKKAPTTKNASSRTAKPLAEYNRKRDFSRTKEPTGVVPKTTGKALHFVVQKHAASHLHYDFRLELDGVMKSWAVPKGPSYDPAHRRLAVEVEDHPIEYNTFEGTIPAGEYGGGTVMLWDRGTYEPDSGDVDDLRRGYERGDIKFTLHGERLQGSFALVRMRGRGESKPQWLVIKHRDSDAVPDWDITTIDTSVATGRTMDEIAGGTRVWHSNRTRKDDSSGNGQP